LPVYTSIPTSTATATALPDISFDVKALKFEKCSGDFWAEVQITNTSENKLAFSSVKLEAQDTDTGTTRLNSSNGFVNRDGCGTYSRVDTLEFEKSAIVSGAAFSYNPNGHIIRVYVTVCTEKDLKGSCRTIRVVIAP